MVRQFHGTKVMLKSLARALNVMERYYGKERNEQENKPRRVRAAVHGLPSLPARSPNDDSAISIFVLVYNAIIFCYNRKYLNTEEKFDKAFVLTLDQEEEITLENKKMIVMPAWRWLLASEPH